MRIPDGLFLAYPALRLSLEQFSPSLLLTFHDAFLFLPLLKLIFDAYLPKDSKHNDIFSSPILTSNELLKQMPKIRIVVGDKDPLHDDCIRLTYNL